MLSFQMENVIDAWRWSSEDSVLHSLPLENVYGIINSLQAPLRVGAKSSDHQSSSSIPKITTFPSLPSLYIQMLSAGEAIFKDKKSKEYVKTTCCKRIRLMTSSTVTLP